MQTNKEQFDVVIIGGGLAGLAAAAYLGRAGKRVCLFERSQTLGGRAQTEKREDFLFNIGAHALYRGGYAMEVLKELGVVPQGAMPLPSGGFAIKDGIKHTFPTGPFSLLTTGLFGLGAKLEVAQWLGTLAKLDTDSLMGITVQEWLNKQFVHPVARELLLALIRVSTYSNAPKEMSAGVALKQLKLAVKANVLYLDGGWQTLVEGLRQTAQTAGVEIKTGIKVESVIRNHLGGVEAVKIANGEVYRVDKAVIAAGPVEALKLLEDGQTTSLAKYAKEAIPIKAACLDVALRELPRPKATFALGIDKPYYFSVHSASAKLALGGGALIHTLKYLPLTHNDSPTSIEHELEGVLDLMQPGWRELVVSRKFLPAMIVCHAIDTAKQGGLKARPTPTVEDVPGLFIAGDWVGDKGLLADASLASARDAANLIISCQKDRLALAG
ncbi:MAG: FAD-dependent oxidoreductase [Acidobacteriota bacterium]